MGARAARAPSIFVLIILILFGLKVGRIWHVTSAEIGSSCPFVMCIVISVYMIIPITSGFHPVKLCPIL